LSSKQTNSKL